jgi:hypothetical protein
MCEARHQFLKSDYRNHHQTYNGQEEDGAASTNLVLLSFPAYTADYEVIPIDLRIVEQPSANFLR